jgi:hypothetical protein
MVSNDFQWLFKSCPMISNGFSNDFQWFPMISNGFVETGFPTGGTGY